VSTLSTESTAPVKASDLDWYKVRLTHHIHNRKVLFRSVSEKRARKFVENRFPRGSEAYLELPDGSEEHYEHERQGEMGTDVEFHQSPTYLPVNLHGLTRKGNRASNHVRQGTPRGVHRLRCYRNDRRTVGAFHGRSIHRSQHRRTVIPRWCAS
jgi:hypothetical protein